MALLGIKIPVQTARLLADVEVPGERIGIHEMHITILLFEDDFPISKIAESLEAAYDIIAKTEPFTIKTKKISCFPPKEGKPHPIIALVESEELHDLCKKLRRKFKKEDIEFDTTFKDYKPHITLAYADKEIKDIKIDPVEVVVQELVLLGGDHSDSRVFITFPLKSPEKHGALLRKCEVFEKWAMDMQEYQNLMTRPMLEPDEGANMINEHQAYIESHPQDLLEIAEKVRYHLWYSGKPRSFPGWVSGYIENLAFAQKIKDHYVQKFTQDYESGSSNLGSITAMEDFFTIEQMRSFLGKLIQRLTSGTEEEVRDAIADLEELLQNSDKLPQNLIMRLLRQFDPNKFAKWYGRERGWEAGAFSAESWKKRSERFLQKEKYETSDIIWFIEKFGESFRYQDFTKIIERSTPAAKKILQSVLWVAGTGQDTAQLFILDSEMKPLTVDDNGNQSNPTFSPETLIDRSSIIDSPAKSPSPYLTLMHDYRIIPYPHTFSHPDPTTDIMGQFKGQQ